MAVPIPTPPLVTGALATNRVRDTVNITTAGQVPTQLYDISDTIYIKNRDAAPFCTLLEAIPGKVEGWGNTHMWYEKQMVPQLDQIAGSMPAGAGTVTVSNGGAWTVNDTLWIPYPVNAEYLVTAIAGNTLTVTQISAPAAAVPVNAVVMRIGNAYPEYSMHQIGPTTKEVQLYNYFQDLRHGRAVSDIEAEARYRVRPKDWDLEVDLAGESHEVEKEKTFLFGAAALLLTGAHPRGFCRGLYNFCATWRTVLPGVPLTQAAFDLFLSGPLEMNTQADQDWWFMCAGLVQRRISGWANPFLRTQTQEHQFGMYISKYQAPTGQMVKIITHPLFHHHRLDGLGILVNMSGRNIKYVYNTKFDTRLYTSLMPFGLSGYDKFYRSNVCLEFKAEDLNVATITGIT